LEQRTWKGADGVAAVKKDGLAVDLGEHFVVRAVRKNNADTVQVNPETGIAIRRFCGKNDGSLLQGARILLHVDTTENEGASITV
jgi:hypothetical protein